MVYCQVYLLIVVSLGFTQHIVRSLARDNKYAVEKEQVIKLIRAIVEIGSARRGPGAAVGCGTVPLSDAVMRAFMAVADHPDEPFKLICLQTLTEICMLMVLILSRPLLILIYSAHRCRVGREDGWDPFTFACTI